MLQSWAGASLAVASQDVQHRPDSIGFLGCYFLHSINVFNSGK
jgi:hypothetical protein